MGTITRTVTLVPSGYEDLSGVPETSGNPISNGYTNAESTTYARFTFSSNVTGSIYYKFDTSEIPASATITSVTARGKARVNNTGRVTNTEMRLYAGTTAKGSSTAFAMTTASTQDLSAGTGWTRADLNNLRLLVTGTATGSSTRRFDFYGADVTITYTITTYDVTASGDGTLTPSGTETVASGDSYSLSIAGLSAKPTVTDNNVDVTSQLTESTERTETAIPNGNTVSGFTASNITNAYHDSDNDSYADLTLAGSTTGTLYLDLSDISLPSGATIKSVECEATVEFNANGSTSGFTSSMQMYAGNTAKGSSRQWVSSGSSVAKNTYTLTVGSLTASEINNARFYLEATNSARSTQRHIYVYGVSFKVTYESDGVTYVYTISSVTGNHTIVVSAAQSSPPVITVGTPNTSRISAITGHDQCVCTFSSDLALQQWEARATKAGTTPARGVGLLVESGGALAANTSATIYVENEELTNGDGEYTITVYGQSTDGVWSA